MKSKDRGKGTCDPGGCSDNEKFIAEDPSPGGSILSISLIEDSSDVCEEEQEEGEDPAGTDGCNGPNDQLHLLWTSGILE
jgi:hypothetical protein